MNAAVRNGFIEVGTNLITAPKKHLLPELSTSLDDLHGTFAVCYRVMSKTALQATLHN